MTPSEKYKTPIIGVIKTKPLSAKWTGREGKHGTIDYPSITYDVIEKQDETYVCNEWHKPGVPLLVHSSEVESYTEKTNAAYAKLIVIANSGVQILLDTLGAIVISDIVETLQDLYKDECRQQEVYENYRYLLLGPSGIGVKEHLEEHMKDEQKHRDILQRYLVSLNKIPTTDRHLIPTLEVYSLDSLMRLNLELETSTVEKYSIVVKGIEALNNPAHVALLNDLQNITSEETEHMQDLQRWLKEKL